MSNTTTAQPEQAFYTLKAFQKALKQRGLPISDSSVRRLISTGKVKATRCLMRPKFWLVPHSELMRLVNQVSQLN